MERGLFFKILLSYFFCLTLTLDAHSPSKEVRLAVQPYLMPSDHPIKWALDELFSAERVTLNQKTLIEAGFTHSTPRHFTKLIVTKHTAFPGYIFKLYLDSQRPHKNFSEDYFWVLRLEGAEKIRHEIAVRGLEHLFKLPKKWIYALPKRPLPDEGYYTKYYILVEEEMDLCSSQENKALWKSLFVTPELLDPLYLLLKKLGLRDCAKPDNIPFSKDGRIAFIDTETHGKKKVPYSRLTPYLSEDNQAYWEALTAHK